VSHRRDIQHPVDEAQDFPAAFLRLCYEILGPDKRLVYAYDELQNLSSTSMAPPEELFGTNSDGSPRVVFSEPAPGEPHSDIILEKCYRNSRPVLVAAHALGFGIYRRPSKAKAIGLVRMFENSQLWHFYNTAFLECLVGLPRFAERFVESIAAEERSIIPVHVPR
jgi:superfamily I DNA and RNA helicase